MTDPVNRSQQLSRALSDLLAQAPEIEAAAVVSFDGLPMASMLPAAMDEDRVAAMSAALLSLGERASEGLGRGALSQVYIEGEHGTVFLVSADDEAVLVAVAAKGAKVGMMLFEVRRAATVVAGVLRAADVVETAVAAVSAPSAAAPSSAPPYQPAYSQPVEPQPVEALPTAGSALTDSLPAAPGPAPASSYGFVAGAAEPLPAYTPAEPPTWS